MYKKNYTHATLKQSRTMACSQQGFTFYFLTVPSYLILLLLVETADKSCFLNGAGCLFGITLVRKTLYPHTVGADRCVSPM